MAHQHSMLCVLALAARIGAAALQAGTALEVVGETVRTSYEYAECAQEVCERGETFERILERDAALAGVAFFTLVLD